MARQLILLPGWGLGSAPLQPLAQALEQRDAGLKVQIATLPELPSGDPADWLAELDERLPQDCWLGGWSLGGMLATALAARRGAGCRGLLTLASNPCFVASESWQTAMPAPTFTAFRQGCALDAPATLKRFALLCSQGAADPRGLGRQLVSAAPHVPAPLLLAGLDLLAALDGRPALQQFRGPQLHLFAAADALVAPAAAQALSALVPSAQVTLIEAASHAFVLQQPELLAGAIDEFLREAGDD